MCVLAETVCVAPDCVDRIWPFVQDILKKATDHCGDWTVEALKSALDNNRAQLWLHCEGTTVRAAAVSQILAVPRGKVCQVVACGGEADNWRDAIAPIEQFGKDEGCVSMRIEGRMGWSRVFRDYAPEWITLDKRLD